MLSHEDDEGLLVDDSPPRKKLRRLAEQEYREAYATEFNFISKSTLNKHHVFCVSCK